MKVNDYEKLVVWQKSMDLVSDIYFMTKSFPREEIYGLTSQIRRSSVSIPSNIAEGSRRSTGKDFRNFLYTSLGSASELETQIMIAYRLKFIEEKANLVITAKISDILRMLNKLIESQTIS